MNVFALKIIFIALTRRDTTTPWTRGLWTRRAFCTSCLGPTTSSTWRVTGCPPAPSRRCEERERLTHDTNNNHKHVFCCCTNKPYVVCVSFSLSSCTLLWWTVPWWGWRTPWRDTCLWLYVCSGTVRNEVKHWKCVYRDETCLCVGWK